MTCRPIAPTTGSTRALFVASIMIACSVVGHAQGLPVYTTNYDIKLSIDNQEYRVNSRALVRSGNEIPNPLQDFKVGIRVSEASTDDVLVQVIVYEKSGSGWHQITVPPPEFSGKLGIPAEYVWESAGMTLDLAIVVGVHRQ